MQWVVAYGAAVPGAMQVGLKRRHVVWRLSQRSALAAAREFVQLRKHKTMSSAPVPFLFFDSLPQHANDTTLSDSTLHAVQKLRSRRTYALQIQLIDNIRLRRLQKGE